MSENFNTLKKDELLELLKQKMEESDKKDKEIEKVKLEAETSKKQVETFLERLEKLEQNKTQVTVDVSNKKRYIGVMHLMIGTTSLTTINNQVFKFIGFGDVQKISLEDLQQLIRDYKYTKLFRNFGFRILEEDVLEELGLDTLYKSNSVTKEAIEDFFKLDEEDAKNQLNNYDKSVQNTIVQLAILGFADNNVDIRTSPILWYLDEMFNISVAELAKKYKEYPKF